MAASRGALGPGLRDRRRTEMQDEDQKPGAVQATVSAGPALSGPRAAARRFGLGQSQYVSRFAIGVTTHAPNSSHSVRRRARNCPGRAHGTASATKPAKT
jgi:hypothetical protein